MLNVAQSQGIIPRHNEIAHDGEGKGQKKPMSWNFMHMPMDVSEMVCPEFVMEDPEGHSKKKQAEQGTDDMEKFLFHGLSHIVISDYQVCTVN
jgi:hypothetical protein